jgi:threonine dehydratase
MTSSTGSVGIQDIERAAEVGRGLVRETPVLPSTALSKRLGSTVALKAENLQRTGSFKVRGALNKLRALGDEALANGVVAASAGNHGQAVAWAATSHGVRSTVFMPASAPVAKVGAVRDYGGDVRLIAGPLEEAMAAAKAAAESEGLAFIHPYDDPTVVAGQGTVGLEIADQVPDVRRVVVPLGGGGLAAGIAVAMKSRDPSIRIFGVRPESTGATICDGIAVKHPGEVTGPMIDELVDEVVSVSDDEAAQAMVLLLERSKQVVEGAGAVAVAALMHGRVEAAADGTTVAILSGGNVDASLLVEAIRLGETAAGRRMVLSTKIPDRPGGLAKLLGLVAELGANVVDVEHLRDGMDLHVRETAVHLVLQTRGRDHDDQIIEAVRAAGYDPHVEH